MKKLRCVLIGATGVAGQQFIAALERHPWFELAGLAASSRSAGKRYVDALKAPSGMVGWFLSEPLSADIAAMPVIAGEAVRGGDFDLAFSAVEADVARGLEPALAKD